MPIDWRGQLVRLAWAVAEDALQPRDPVVQAEALGYQALECFRQSVKAFGVDGALRRKSNTMSVRVRLSSGYFTRGYRSPDKQP